MIDAAEAIGTWEDTVEHILHYCEPEEVNNGLINRDIVEHELGPLTVALRARVEAADREFIRIRPTLVERFPGEFNPKYWNATEDEWWWWPDRLPAEFAHSAQ